VSDASDHSRRARQNLPPSPYDRSDEVIFEPLGGFAPDTEGGSEPEAPTVFRRPGPVPAGPAPSSTGPTAPNGPRQNPSGNDRGQASQSWIDLAAPGPPIVFEGFPEEGEAETDSAIGPFRSVPRHDRSVAWPEETEGGGDDQAPWPDGASNGPGLGFEPVPFDDRNVGSAWRGGQPQEDPRSGEAPIETDFFEDRRLPMPALPNGSSSRHSPDRQRSRFSLPIRLALPILLITLGAVGLVLFARARVNNAQGEVIRLENIHRIELDNSASEGTLLRTRRALENTVGAGPVSAATARDMLPYLEKRQLEIDTYEDRLARTELPAGLKQNLTAAYADDHSYIEDSINILTKSVDSPAEAKADLQRDRRGPSRDGHQPRQRPRRAVVRPRRQPQLLAAAADPRIAGARPARPHRRASCHKGGESSFKTNNPRRKSRVGRRS
jgi:hypothetical protein